MALTTEDPDLASYHSPAYLAIVDDLRFVGDMYEGRGAWIKSGGQLVGDRSRKYLPQEPNEKDKSYTNRLRRSHYERRFGNAIDAFAGLLSRFSQSGRLPNGMEEYFDRDVDRMRNSLAKFLIQADRYALRDGGCFILVDFPRRPTNADGQPLTYLQSQELKLRPYLTLYQANQVVNLRVVKENSEIDMVSIHEFTWEPIGRFGHEMVEWYRVLYPGGGELYRVIKNEVPTAVKKESLQLESEWQTTMNLLTLIPYSIGISGDDFYGTKPPFLDLALLNLKHYQKSSEKDELMHKCNIPILTINRPAGLPKTTTTSRPTPTNSGTKTADDPEVTIGPNTVLFNVQATYVEPTGAALALTIQDLSNLEAAMSQKTLDFLTLGDVSRTATEVVHTAAPLSSSLSGMIVAKENAVRKIFDYWAMYVDGDHDASIQIDEGSIRSTINSSNIDRLAGLRTTGNLSQTTYLTLLKEARVLPATLDIVQEQQLIAAELVTASTTPLP
jgi:Domain of unknown function (DUF4055)